MAKMEGVESLIDKLKNLGDAAKKDSGSVVTGYTAKYALPVHENREIWPPGMRLAGLPRWKPRKGLFWDPQGSAQPGFLLEPARKNRQKIIDVVKQSAKRGMTLMQSLYNGGMFLQRESMLLVPVDLGNLKQSAFTAIEEDQ